MFYKNKDLKQRGDGKWELWVKKTDDTYEVIIFDNSELEVLIGKFRKAK